MPEASFDALDADRLEQAAEYVPGYDWIPGRFGPPPGILKERKEQLDRMSDKEFLYAFLKLSQEEKESLMASEIERGRTFAACWPIEAIVKAHDCAKEGFYYTGVADRVQCAFCRGIVRNWERGDVPKDKHENFDSCKIVQSKPCPNIPISNYRLLKNLITSQLSSSVRDDRKEEMETSDEHVSIKKLDGYKYCRSLEYPAEIIAKAYKVNGDVEFEEPNKLVGIVQELFEGNSLPLEEYKKEVASRKDDQSVTTGVTDSTTQPGRINGVEPITNLNGLSEQEAKYRVDAVRYKKRRKNMFGAAVHP